MAGTYKNGVLKMKTLSASATVTIQAIAAKKKMKGENVYHFAAGDPILPNHHSIINRAIRQTEKKFCPYPPVEGLPELRSLFAEWINSRYHTQYTKENVLVTCGGKFALFAIIYALLQSNEEVLIPAPYWVSYPEIVKMAGGVPKIVPTYSEGDWKITAQDLLQHITKKSKILIFNNACNPTGALYTKEEISNILALAKKFDLLVISDEVYSGLVYEKPGFISCGAYSEHEGRVLIVQSCSKNFGMTGWRVGFILAPENSINRLAILQSQSTTGVSAISQWGAVGALENAEEVNTYVRNSMQKRRNLFTNTFHSLFPIAIEKIKSALYAFVSLSSLGIHNMTDSVAFSQWLIDSYNIAVVPGTAFGVEAYVRFAFSESEEDIYQGLHLLKQAISRLNGERK